MKTISIISPCFNEADNVRACYDAVKALFAKGAPLAKYRCEHIFADNASTDGTVEILRELAAEDPSIKVILNARNYGPFRSNFNALRAATGDAVLVFLPVDLAGPAGDDPGVRQALGKRRRGRRRGARQPPGKPRAAGLPRSFLPPRQVAFGRRHPGRCRRVPADRPQGLAGGRPARRPLSLHPRDHRLGRLSPGDRALHVGGPEARPFQEQPAAPDRPGAERHLLVHDVPMRLCTFAGLAMAGLCFLYATFAFGLWFVRPDLAPRGMTTIIVALFFLSGMQLTFIGILGEYVTSIHSQVRKRPLVVERERLNMGEGAPANPVHDLQKKIADAA